jgi:predicted permease
VRWAIGAAALKTTVGPLAGLFFGVTFGLSTEELRLALVFLACPTASAAYVLVQQMDGDTALVASTIVLSHLFALPVMLLVLALTA